jgi:hypothetical protein
MDDILYLESDSEITEAIDKLKESGKETVKLVVPARSSLLQSAVNVKLLKKTADNAKKNLVLITNDKTAKAIAGTVGIAVAASLKAEPKIPEVESEPVDSQPDIIEQPKGVASEDSQKPSDFEGEQIKPNRSQYNSQSVASKKKHKPKKEKVPSYSKLQKRIFIALAIIFGFVSLILGLMFLTNAKVIIFADGQKKEISPTFSLDSSISKSDFDKQAIAAKKVEINKDVSMNFTATGKKNVGTKATGKISIQNCDDTNTHNLASGSVVSSSGKKFTTNEAVTIKAGSAGGGVVSCSTAVEVGISASEAGDSYNLNGASFSLAGFSALYKATGSTSGGTSKEISVVSQADVDNAKKQMLEQNNAAAKDELTKKDSKNTKVFQETFNSEMNNFKSNPEVGSEASNASVSATINYSMLSASNDDLDKLFSQEASKDIENTQQIYSSGYENASYKLIKLSPGGSSAQMKANTNAYIGSKVDSADLSKKVAGKPKKQVEDIVRQNISDIKNVQVEALPFWPNMPMLSNNIKIEIKVSTD